MHKIIYLIRHCQAAGQAPEAPLTTAGRAQAQALASFLSDSKIERIVSSPFLRAIQSIEPLAHALELEIETDERLVERILSNAPLPDWLTCLRDTFADLDLSFPGGETSRMATQRAVSALQDTLDHEQRITALVSHGNLSTLLLGHFDKAIGFSTWKHMTNPDVFRIYLSDDKATIEHIWKPAP